MPEHARRMFIESLVFAWQVIFLFVVLKSIQAPQGQISVGLGQVPDPKPRSSGRIANVVDGLNFIDIRCHA